jgi:phospholipase/carboxylesterase
MTTPTLPDRRGPRPTTVGPAPHAQTSQVAPAHLQETLLARGLALPLVDPGPSRVSVPGARAFLLAPQAPTGPAAAFQADREFAHLHPPADGSLHMTLPDDVGHEAVTAGWAEPHPISGVPLVYGPRDEGELETVWTLLLASYRFALGGDR